MDKERLKALVENVLEHDVDGLRQGTGDQELVDLADVQNDLDDQYAALRNGIGLSQSTSLLNEILKMRLDSIDIKEYDIFRNRPIYNDTDEN